MTRRPIRATPRAGSGRANAAHAIARCEAVRPRQRRSTARYSSFLYREAELLDSNRVLPTWLELFADDVLLRQMPVRTTQCLSQGLASRRVSFFDDNIHSLRTRVRAAADRVRPGPRRRPRARGIFVSQRAGRRRGIALTASRRRRHNFHRHAHPRRAGLPDVRRSARGHCCAASLTIQFRIAARGDSRRSDRHHRRRT